MWVYAAIIIVSVLISVALAPKPETPEAATLDDVDAPTAEDGKPIGVVFGDAWVTGPNVIWYGDLKASPIYAKGGK